MKSLIFLAGILAASLGLAQVNCLPMSELGEHTVIDEYHVDFNAGTHGVFEFTLTAGCEFRFSDFVGFKSFDGSQICRGDEMMSYQHGIGETGSCVIEQINKK